MNSSSSPQTPIPLTVSQLTQAIKYSLESTFPFIHLQGEVSNFKQQTSGHLYFSLKDQEAQIAAVMFKGDANLLKQIPKGGEQVIVKGELSVYPPKGSYQLVVRELAFVGLGILLQQLEALKIKLHQAGWFKSSRKKKLPSFPQRIGVITSPTGAVIQDILNVLSRRFSSFHLILNPVKVQGEGAAVEIARAIREFNEYDLVDVMIVGRGGGSLEDLWAFNEEIVAQAIFESRIPIISAVGHETDHCIADYVADVRAPTPSAAAEIVIAEKNQQLENLQIYQKRLAQALIHRITRQRAKLEGILRHPLFVHPHYLLEWRMQRLDDYAPLLEQSIQQFLRMKKQSVEAKSTQAFHLKPLHLVNRFRQKFQSYRQSLDLCTRKKCTELQHQLFSLDQALLHLIQKKQIQYKGLFNEKRLQEMFLEKIQDSILMLKQKIAYKTEILESAAPQNLLKKGYSIVFAENNSFVIKSVRDASVGQTAKIQLSDGELFVRIEAITPLKKE